MLLSFLGSENACPIVRCCIYARCARTVRMPEKVPHLPCSSSATGAFLWGLPLPFLPLFTGVRGIGILRSSDAASCIVRAYRAGFCHSTPALRILVNTTCCGGG